MSNCFFKEHNFTAYEHDLDFSTDIERPESFIHCFFIGPTYLDLWLTLTPFNSLIDNPMYYSKQFQSLATFFRLNCMLLSLYSREISCVLFLFIQVQALLAYYYKILTSQWFEHYISVLSCCRSCNRSSCMCFNSLCWAADVFWSLDV